MPFQYTKKIKTKQKKLLHNKRSKTEMAQVTHTCTTRTFFGGHFHFSNKNSFHSGGPNVLTSSKWSDVPLLVGTFGPHQEINTHMCTCVYTHVHTLHRGWFTGLCLHKMEIDQRKKWTAKANRNFSENVIV